MGFGRFQLPGVRDLRSTQRSVAPQVIQSEVRYKCACVDLNSFSRQVLASWVKTCVPNPSHVRVRSDIVIHRMYARSRSVMGCRCVRACNFVHVRSMGACVRRLGTGAHCPLHADDVGCTCAVCTLCLAEVGCSVSGQALMCTVLFDEYSRPGARDRGLYIRAVCGKAKIKHTNSEPPMKDISHIAPNLQP